jgi:hypothetical protein
MIAAVVRSLRDCSTTALFHYIAFGPTEHLRW